LEVRRWAVGAVALWLVSALFLGMGAVRAASPSEDVEAGFVGRIGDERAAAGLGGYVVAADLVDVARRHAEEMRRQQRLHHNPNLAGDVQNWQAVGENVGVGSSVEAIHQKFMESPSHRDNILSARFTEVGVGVVVDGPDLWVVQVFRLPKSAEPAPAAGPESGPPAESSPSTTEPAPRPAPEPRPAAAPAPASGSATVRAAGVGSGPGAATAAPATTSPTPPGDRATPTTPTTESAEIPTSLVDAGSSTRASTLEAGPGVSGATASTVARAATRASVQGERFGSTSERQVTWPVALAATMLLGVVTALAIHVGGAKVRSVAAAGRRTSLIDVWELALAR
jgi:hypothetical protein